MIDPKDPERATLAPSPSGAGVKVTTVSADGGSPVEVDLGNDSVRDVVALSPRLREHSQLGIAKVVSISATATTAKQLDALVLGPQFLLEGAKATGSIVSAVQQPMNNPALEAKGCSKWQLVIDVKPEDGSSPYQATLAISFTNPEKAQRAARVGAGVPLRYDPMDRQTFAIDSIAMGYGDPYETVRQMMLPNK